MQPFKSILVDIDAMAVAHPALDRAIELARACGARVKIVDVVAVPSDARSYMSSETEELLVNRRRERLATVAGAAKDISADFEVLSGRPSVALIQQVLRSGHDLLVRSHARDLAVRRNFGAIDMQLFRQCPCPVWAVGPGARSAPRHVLAAVHATPDDPEEEALNTKILETALLMAERQGATLTVFQAWTAFGEDLLRSHSTPENVAAYAKAAERTAQQSMDRLVALFGGRLASAHIELKKGYAEDIMPPFVVSQGIDLVVMGTVARSGLAGFLIGNTAERLLQRLVCSVVAVKPDGFVTPVPRDMQLHAFDVTRHDSRVVLDAVVAFHFMNASPAEAREAARDAAAGRDVRLGGGATLIREFLAAGLVDYMRIVVVPILLGRGVRL